MPPKETHEDFMETQRKESPYSTVKNGQQSSRGSKSVKDDEWPGRPKDDTADENVKVVHTLVMCNRRRDLRSRASQMSISFGAVQSILTDILGMSKVSARWVPRMLTIGQKRTRLYISRHLLSRYEDNPGDLSSEL